MTRTLLKIAPLSAIAIAVSATAGPLPDAMKEALRSKKQIHVATQRDDRSRGKPAPVWFWWDGTHLYFTTGPQTYKARRIRRGSPVFVSVEGAQGPFVQGRAEIVTDPGIIARMGEAYSQKYWIAWLGLFRPRVERVADGRTVAVRVTFE